MTPKRTQRTNRMRVGADFGDTPAAVTAGLHDLPGTFMSRVFAGPGHGVPPWSRPDIAALVRAGVRVHKSMKDWDEHAITADMDAIPAEVISVVYTYHHEPQDDYGLANAPQFVQRCQRLTTLARAHRNAARIRCVPILNGWPIINQGQDWHPWWGPNMGDAMGWDIYPNTAKGYMSAAKALAVPVAATAEVKLPLWVPELGSVRASSDRDGTGCAAWMTDMLTGLAAAGCQRVNWWYALGGKDKTGRVKDMRLSARGPELAVWQKATATQ